MEKTFLEPEESFPVDPSMLDTPFSKVNAINVIQTPTNPTWIQKKSVGGKQLDYVSGTTVTRILNKAFSYCWSFYILETRVVQSEDKIDKKSGVATPQSGVVQVHGRLVVPGMGVREQWGAQPLSGGSDVQEHAFNSAATAAMKNCASLFGVTLDLNGDEGMYELQVGMDDLIIDDAVVLDKYKERKKEAYLAAKKQAEAQQVLASAPATPDAVVPTADPVVVVPDAPVAPTVETVSQEVFEEALEESVQNMPSPYGEEQPEPTAEEPAPTPEPPVVVETQVPVQPEYMQDVPLWDNADVTELVELKKALGIKNNYELDVYAQEHFGIPDATHVYIAPNNIKDFNLFLKNKLTQA